MAIKTKKKCAQCNKTKILSFKNFYRSKQTKNGFKPWCKLCVNAANKIYDEKHPKQRTARTLKSRNRSVASKAMHVNRSTKWRINNPVKYRDSKTARNFNVPKGWLTEQLERTKGRCEICNVKHLSKKHPRFISVDHNHKTGKVRGLLCGTCSFGIGHFKDDVQLLKKAIKYLEDHNAKTTSFTIGISKKPK